VDLWIFLFGHVFGADAPERQLRPQDILESDEGNCQDADQPERPAERYDCDQRGQREERKQDGADDRHPDLETYMSHTYR
jgi:hypothetical protein